MIHSFSSSLSVQIGQKGNIAGSYLWQIRDNDDLLFNSSTSRQQYYTNSTVGDEYLPKTVIVDQDNQFVANPYDDEDQSSNENAGVWDGKSSVVKRTPPKFQPMRRIRNKAYHHKSIIKAPKFPSKTWYYGGLSDGELSNMEEDTLEGLRHFAEISDYIEAIDLYIDLESDLGIFCERLLDSIRSDYGRSVSLPLWMVEQSNPQNSHMFDSTLLAQEKAKTLTSLTNSLAIARFSEYTDLLIPLTPDSLTVTDVLDDIQTPFGIATAYSFRTADPKISTKEWIDSCSARKTFPICGFESLCFPSSPEHGQPDIDSFFLTENGGTRQRHSIPINPMMHRRSPVVPSSANTNIAFTNFTVFRGWNDENLPTKLYKQVRNGSYYMSHCLSYAPPINGSLSRLHEDQTFHYSVAVASSVYADSSIGDYVLLLEKVWSQGSAKVREQLSKVSIEADEIQQVSEDLMTIANHYHEA